MSQRRILGFETISHMTGDDRVVAKLECGHEMEMSGPLPDLTGKKFVECVACGREDVQTDDDWTQVLVISLFKNRVRVYKLDLPSSVGDDEEGRFAIVQPHEAKIPPVEFDEVKVEMKFRRDGE